MNRTEIVAFVASAGILNEYQSKDKCLNDLINIALKSPESWQSREDISIGEQLVPASQIERTFRMRLSHIPDEGRFFGDEQMQIRQLKSATKRLVDYCTDHPDADITGVIFNCTEYSYSVFCGVTNQQLDAICVIQGKTVPAYAVRRQPPAQ